MLSLTHLSVFKFLDQEDREYGTVTTPDSSLKIANLHHVDIETWLKEDDHVYVGRAHGNIPASKWANPYIVNDGDDINVILSQYEEHVTSTPDLANDLGSLRGKILGCWCIPNQRCHAEVLQNLIGS